MLYGTPEALAAASLCLFLPLSIWAQAASSKMSRAASLPPAWQVIERHLDAAGGRAAFLKLQSRDVWAHYQLPARHLDGDLRVFSARPDRLVIRTEYGDLGTGVTGFNGSIGWTIQPGGRAALVTGGELADLHADAVFDRYDEENLLAAETLEVTEFEGRRCLKLRVVRVPDRESFEYFDVETGLFAGSVARRATDKGPVTMITVVSRYQATDGVRLPRLLRIRMGGVEQIITVARVVHNHVDPAIFNVPASLRGTTR